MLDIIVLGPGPDISLSLLDLTFLDPDLIVIGPDLIVFILTLLDLIVLEPDLIV